MLSLIAVPRLLDSCIRYWEVHLIYESLLNEKLARRALVILSLWSQDFGRKLIGGKTKAKQIKTKQNRSKHNKTTCETIKTTCSKIKLVAKKKLAENKKLLKEKQTKQNKTTPLFWMKTPLLKNKKTLER